MTRRPRNKPRPRRPKILDDIDRIWPDPPSQRQPPPDDDDTDDDDERRDP